MIWVWAGVLLFCFAVQFLPWHKPDEWDKIDQELDDYDPDK